MSDSENVISEKQIQQIKIQETEESEESDEEETVATPITENILKLVRNPEFRKLTENGSANGDKFVFEAIGDRLNVILKQLVDQVKAKDIKQLTIYVNLSGIRLADSIPMTETKLYIQCASRSLVDDFIIQNLPQLKA
ncbi:MAG: hypothetical protein EZS28_038381 [Streblomastix strix]|uniref:Uncharacterized protein n=1 Tax=Streblomastix strix TaxID=222440 RepID=A0A5J4U7Z9_9EUKA|nr:MAG: hypothetical protein EZS28_038381 [Streblomastix strix]